MVLTGPWLVSVSVVLPGDDRRICRGIDAGYEFMALPHVEALHRLGLRRLEASKGHSTDAAPTNARWACFGSVMRGEITDALGRKLVGFAQRRQAGAALLVGGTLVSPPDWHLLCEAAGRPEDLPQLAARTVDCERLSGRPVTAARLAQALSRCVGDALEPVLARRRTLRWPVT